MFRTVFIDDEAPHDQTFKRLIEQHCPNLDLVGEAVNVATGLELIKKENPEVVFLDIQMPDGTGFDLLDQLDKIDFHLIFTTAHEMYAIKAFKYSAIDYLLKPVDVEELISATERLPAKGLENTTKERVDLLLESRRDKEFKDLAINTADGLMIFPISEIIRFEADGPYCIVYGKGGKSVIASKPLKEYGEMLPSEDFVRIHKSHLVAKKFIDQVTNDDDVELTDGQILPLARRRRPLVLELLK